MPPVTVTLKMTSPLFNDDPAGAPLPLGRRQCDAGTIEMGGTTIGEYIRIKDVAPGSMNTAAVTITLLFPAPTPLPITLQGSHSFSSGDELGSVSAAGTPGLTGVLFTVAGDSQDLTLFLP